MYAEISKETFRHLIPVDMPCDQVEEQEHCRKEYYSVLGCRAMVVQSFAACCTQYYLIDINA